MRYFPVLAPLSCSLALLALSGSVGSPPVQAQAQLTQPMATQSHSDYVAELGRRALSEGVRSSTVNAVVPTLTLDSRVISLDRGQPGGAPNGPIPKFEPYRRSHVDAARIAGGRLKYQALRPFLARVERDTGVPESIMVSIYGNETAYGKVTGNFDLLNALATLAYEGRRRQLFADEFIATLKLMDRGIPRSQLKGSWAGATGYPQFLPSMYARLGADGDGDGRADIWNSEADALASIANYFVNAGWKPGQHWGMAVRVPATLDRTAIAGRMTSPRCPRVHARHSQWKTVAEWKALGIVPLGGGKTLADGDFASLLEPDGPDATGYLLTGNYRVILDYNCSNFYGLAVGLLSDAVER